MSDGGNSLDLVAYLKTEKPSGYISAIDVVEETKRKHDALIREAREIIESFAKEKINGHSIDKLLKDLVPLLSANGAHQNIYALVYLIDERQRAQAFLDKTKE